MKNTPFICLVLSLIVLLFSMIARQAEIFAFFTLITLLLIGVNVTENKNI